MKRSFQKFLRKLDEIGLREAIEKRSLKFHVSLLELYEGQGRTPSIGAARKSVYSWLFYTKKKGINEIARLFDRAPSGVLKLARKGADRRARRR